MPEDKTTGAISKEDREALLQELRADLDKTYGAEVSELRTKLAHAEGRLAEKEASAQPSEFDYSTPGEWEAHYERLSLLAQAEDYQNQQFAEEGKPPSTEHKDRLVRLQSAYQNDFLPAQKAEEETRQATEAKFTAFASEHNLTEGTEEYEIARAAVDQGVAVETVKEHFLDRVRAKANEEGDEAARKAAADAALKRGSIEGGEHRTQPPGEGDEKTALTKEEAVAALKGSAKATSGGRIPPTAEALFGKAAAVKEYSG
jgi:hypothetical protein